MKYEKTLVILATVTLSISFLPVMAQDKFYESGPTAEEVEERAKSILAKQNTTDVVIDQNSTNAMEELFEATKSNLSEEELEESVERINFAVRIENARNEILGGGDVEEALQSLKTPQDGLAIWGDRLEIVIGDLYVECVSMKEKNEIPASEKCIKWARNGANILLN